MTELRAEAVDVIKIIPEEYLLNVIEYAKKFLKTEKSAFGMLSKYADKNLIEQEKTAWESEVAKKYGKNFD